MRIGIDIDDTVAQTSKRVIQMAIEYDKTLRGTGLLDENKYYLEDAFDWNEEETKEFFTINCEEIFGSLDPIEDSKRAVEELKKMGHEIYFITARSTYCFKDPYKTSSRWLNNHGYYYDKLIVSSGIKGSVCVNEKIDILIDDTPKQCYDVIAHGKEAYLFNAYYNQDIEDIPRVNNWEEVIDALKEVSCG